MFARVVKAPNGDPELVASANREIYQIGTVAPPPNPNPTPTPPPAKNPPDYGPVMGEVRSLISQANWDAADAKLNGVPPTQPEYTELKRQIDSGRREDQAFAEKKAEYTQAAASKSKEALRGLRPFFMGEANKPGRHDSEARTIVTQLDADLKELEVVKPPSGGTGGGTTTIDATAIRSVVDSFAIAMSERNLDKVKSVRKLSASEEKAYKETVKALAGTKGYRMVVQSCAAPQLTGDTVTVSCRILNEGQNIKADPFTQIYSLQRIDGKWMIVASN
jgi:hypothetical protein